MLFEKTELKGRTGEKRCSYFLLLIGEKGREIHKTLTFAEPETETGEDGRPVWKRTTEQLRKAFREYCSPQKNVTYERHKFNIRNQTENESIDQYVTELRTLASTCEFENLKDGLIRDRVIFGIRNQALKERLLREASLTLKSAVDICRAAEFSREQVKSLTDSPHANIDELNQSGKQSYNTEITLLNKETSRTLLDCSTVAIVVNNTQRNRAQLMGKGVTTVIKSDILLNYVAQPRIHDFATQFVKSNTKSSVT